MRLIDAIRYRQILRNYQTNSTYYDEKKCRELLGELIDTLDEQPTVPPAEKVLSETKIERDTLSEIMKDIIADNEAAKEHEHNYSCISRTDEKRRSLGHGGEWEHYKIATLICTRCGELKQVEVDKHTVRH